MRPAEGVSWSSASSAPGASAARRRATTSTSRTGRRSTAAGSPSAQAVRERRPGSFLDDDDCFLISADGAVGGDETPHSLGGDRRRGAVPVPRGRRGTSAGSLRGAGALRCAFDVRRAARAVQLPAVVPFKVGVRRIRCCSPRCRAELARPRTPSPLYVDTVVATYNAEGKCTWGRSTAAPDRAPVGRGSAPPRDRLRRRGRQRDALRGARDRAAGVGVVQRLRAAQLERRQAEDAGVAVGAEGRGRRASGRRTRPAMQRSERRRVGTITTFGDRSRAATRGAGRARRATRSARAAAEPGSARGRAG